MKCDQIMRMKIYWTCDSSFVGNVTSGLTGMSLLREAKKVNKDN